MRSLEENDQQKRCCSLIRLRAVEKTDTAIRKQRRERQPPREPRELFCSAYGAFCSSLKKVTMLATLLRTSHWLERRGAESLCRKVRNIRPKVGVVGKFPRRCSRIYALTKIEFCQNVTSRIGAQAHQTAEGNGKGRRLIVSFRPHDTMPINFKHEHVTDMILFATLPTRHSTKYIEM